MDSARSLMQMISDNIANIASGGNNNNSRDARGSANMADPPDEDLAQKTAKLNIASKEKKALNILLLGETGAGKSTFINALVNYLTYPDLAKAEKDTEKLQVLIPTMITVTDKDNKTHTVRVGEKCQNETVKTGASATQDVKTYVFDIPNRGIEIRLIDTPGMGDTRGIKQDDKNCETILSYIAKLHHLHAICFLFRSTQSRGTVLFQYCMAQILSRLDKSANKNICFIFTNTKAADYGPGETMPLLLDACKKIEEAPPHVTIPFNKNLFCFENEAFRYLAASKNKIEFSDQQKKGYKESWKRSIEQCNAMIEYIDKLDPHFVKHTNAINEVRRAIMQLAKPLADVTQLINQNMNILKRHEENLNVETDDLNELRKKLFMPGIELELEKLMQPLTICSKKGCAEITKIAGENIYNYKQKCHNPCYLTDVEREIIGDPALQNCACIDKSTGNCTVCGCSFRLHLHIYYLTRSKEVQKESGFVKKQMDSKEKMMEAVRKLIEKMRKRQNELDDEYKVIVCCSARFAHFLQKNAITPINDYYKEYIVYLIEREKLLGSACNMQTIRSLEELIRQYETEKSIFERALKSGESNDQITPEVIQKSINDLYKLKHNGTKIKQLFDCQKAARKSEHKYTEYVHKGPVSWGKAKTKDEDKKKKGGPDGGGGGGQQKQKSGRKQGGRSPPPTYRESVRPQQQQHHHQNQQRQYNQNQPYYGQQRTGGYQQQQQQPPPLMGQPPYQPPYSGGPPPYGGQQPYGNPPVYSPPPGAATSTTFDFRDPGTNKDPTIHVTINHTDSSSSSSTNPPTTPNPLPPGPYPSYPGYQPHPQGYQPPPPPGQQPGYPGYPPQYNYPGYPPPPPPPPHYYPGHGHPGYYPPAPGPSQHYDPRHHQGGYNRGNQQQHQDHNRNPRGGNKGFRGGRGGGITRKRNNKNFDKKNKNKNKGSSDSDESDTS